jgi:uncharacterized membrane protein YfcA
MMNWPDPVVYLLFIGCTAIATYVQNLTGFAFALILLGLVSVLRLASVADAANAATVLTLINAGVYFRLHGLTPQWRIMRPALPTSLIGVAVGVALLAWLSGNAVHWLRGLLGLSIVACAVLLLVHTKPRAQLSGSGPFALVGALSGLMGGLFSSAGPPLVYHMYRQPLDRIVVQHCLVLMFAVNQVLRLVLVVASGKFSLKSVAFSACAVPAVYLVTRLHHRHPPTMSMDTVRRIVSGLLMVAGGSLIASALASSEL